MKLSEVLFVISITAWTASARKLDENYFRSRRQIGEISRSTGEVIKFLTPRLLSEIEEARNDRTGRGVAYGSEYVGYKPFYPPYITVQDRLNSNNRKIYYDKEYYSFRGNNDHVDGERSQDSKGDPFPKIGGYSSTKSPIDLPEVHQIARHSGTGSLDGYQFPGGSASYASSFASVYVLFDDN